MYVYCVYPATSKCSIQLPNCLKRAETTSVVLVVINGVPYHILTYSITISYNLQNAAKPADVVTCIKQPPALKGHLFPCLVIEHFI